MRKPSPQELRFQFAVLFVGTALSVLGYIIAYMLRLKAGIPARIGKLRCIFLQVTHVAVAKGKIGAASMPAARVVISRIEIPIVGRVAIGRLRGRFFEE